MRFGIEKQEMIYPEGTRGSVHASTLVKTEDGRVLSAWFCGEKEGAPDVSIFGAVRSSGGVWSAPVQWARAAETAHWNPVLFYPEPGKNIYLFFKIGVQCECWKTMWCRSADFGRTWSKPEELVRGAENARGPVKNKPVVLSDGSWLAPNSLEDGRRWRVMADRSTDGGATWISSPEIEMDRYTWGEEDWGAIQPSFWESAPGKVHLLARSTNCVLYRSDSGDYGRTWCKLYKTELPGNNSGIDLARGESGIILLACNPVGKNWGPRTPLSLFGSRDNGGHWERLIDLETAEGEYSYPAVIALPGNRFAGTYTCRRRTIVYWEGVVEH